MQKKVKKKKGWVLNRKNKTKIYKAVALMLVLITLSSTVLTAMASFGLFQPQINYDYDDIVYATPSDAEYSETTPSDADIVAATPSDVE